MLFAASEMALIAADKNKLQEKADEGNNRAKLILKIREDQSRFLSTIQVGITFAGFSHLPLLQLEYLLD